jgi:hypothetical protein
MLKGKVQAMQMTQHENLKNSLKIRHFASAILS